MSGALTIAIPTYDRPEALARTLRRLEEIWDGETPVWILDNHSPKPAHDVVAESGLGTEFRSAVRVVRHPANVGIMTNILRCFEVCETEWLWVLSDDDEVRAGALEQIKRDIDGDDQLMHVAYSSDCGRHDPGWCGPGMEGFLDGRTNVGALLFISTNVYRIGRMRLHLRFGHLSAQSLAAHLGLVLKGWKDGGVSRFAREEIVVWHKAVEAKQQWSLVPMALGLMLLLELPLNLNERELRLLQRRLMPMVPSPRLCTALLRYRAPDLGTALRRRMLEQIYARCYLFNPYIRLAWLKLVVSRWLLDAPEWVAGPVLKGSLRSDPRQTGEQGGTYDRI